MAKNNQRLHELIGDYKREIDKISARQGSTKKLSMVTRLGRIRALKDKISKAALTLQKMNW